MKIPLLSRIRFVALAATLAFGTANASELVPSSPDRLAELLARSGSIPVKAAGLYVEIGTFRIQVTTMLGRPGAKLPDGTLLYANYCVEDTDIHGTLVVYFAEGRVNRMALVSPVVAAAMTTLTASPGKRATTNVGVVDSIICRGGLSAKSLE